MIEIKSEEDIKSFKDNYGDHSFILHYSDKDKKAFKCVKNLAEDKFKQNFYIGYIKNNSSRLVVIISNLAK
jgi:hypothetical protein